MKFSDYVSVKNVREEIKQELENDLRNLTPLKTVFEHFNGVSSIYLSKYLDLVKPGITEILENALCDYFCDSPQDFYAHLMRYQINYGFLGIYPNDHISFNFGYRGCYQSYDSYPRLYTNKANHERVRLICGSSKKTMEKIIY